MYKRQVLQVDDLAYEILEYYDIYSQDVIFKKLKNKYSKLNIKETFEEIQTLKEQGYLFTDINLIPILDKLHTKQYVKALCLNVAHDCNLRCKYCFASKGDYHGKRELMSIEAVSYTHLFH